MKLAIDIDGVMARFDTPFAALLTQLTGKPCTIDEPDEWEWPKKMGFTKLEEDQAWDHIRQNPTWWGSLTPYADSFVNFRDYERAGWDLYFITARRMPFVRHITAAWIKQHYLIDYPTVLLTSKKGIVCKALGIDAFIDDKPEMTVDVKQKSPFTRVYLRTRVHNTLAQPYIERDGITLIDSLESMFERELERLRPTL